MLIGFANGCMDRLHPGHCHFISECLDNCDYLILAINSDASIKRLKGATRPLWPLKDRIWAIKNQFPFVAVIPFEGREDKLIMEIRPDVVFKGYDHGHESLVAARNPGWKDGEGMWMAKVIQISHLPGYSTSASL